MSTSKGHRPKLKPKLRNPQAKEFHKIAERNEFDLVRHNSHLVYQRAGCQPVVVSASPSDSRALKNNVKRLERILAAANKPFKK